jgi:hypothetical protein
MSDDIDDDAVTSARHDARAGVTWYDPQGWTRWLRWLLALPLSLLAAVIIYFVYYIANSFFPDMPTAVTGLLAVLIGSTTFVLCGRYVAPSFDRYVGYTLGVALLVFAGYVLGMILTQGSGSSPKWYALLMPVAAAVGALYACFADLSERRDHSGSEMFSWMPGPLRWLTFIPVALFLAVAACFALGLPLASLRINEDVIRLVNTPILIAVFIGVAAAVAPSHKKAVAITLGLLIALFSIVLFLSALDRPLTVQIVPRIIRVLDPGFFERTHFDPSSLTFAMSVWYQIMSSTSALAGVLIAILATSEVAKMPRVPS